MPLILFFPREWVPPVPHHRLRPVFLFAYRRLRLLYIYTQINTPPPLQRPKCCPLVPLGTILRLDQGARSNGQMAIVRRAQIEYAPFPFPFFPLPILNMLCCCCSTKTPLHARSRSNRCCCFRRCYYYYFCCCYFFRRCCCCHAAHNVCAYMCAYMI